MFTALCPQSRRIQGGGSPIGNTHQQKNKGDQRVQKTGHHVTDGSAEHTRVNTHSSANILVVQEVTRVSGGGTLSSSSTHLLASWMRAMAIRILLRRKMSVRRMTASATDTMITEDRTRSSHQYGAHATAPGQHKRPDSQKASQVS